MKWYNKVGYGSGDIAGNVVYVFLTAFSATTQPASGISMLNVMYLWLPFVFDLIVTVVLSFMNIEEANKKLKENKQ